MVMVEELTRENDELRERMRELSATVEAQTRRADLALERGELQAREAQEHIRALEDREDSRREQGRELELRLADAEGLLKGKTHECTLLLEKSRTQARMLKDSRSMVSFEDHEVLQAELASAQKKKASERTGMVKKVAELDNENKRLHGLLNELEGLERGSQESTVGLWRKEKEGMLTSMSLQRTETKRQQLQFETKLQDLKTEHEAERRTSEAQIRQLMTQLSSATSAAPRSIGLFGLFGQGS